jgi:hypothetical protein
MTDITSSCTIYTAVAGDLKVITVVTPSTAATGDTIDLASDATDGRGAIMKTILNTVLQDDEGADKTGTFVQSTGVYTLGTITTGIHNLTVIGRG